MSLWLSMTDLHLAEANIARMRYSLDDSRMRGFVSGLGHVNELAENADGFVWRFQTESGDATGVRVLYDPLILFNMSVWRSLESLLRFTYLHGHGDYFRRRKEWFEPPARDSLVLWWIPASSLPSVDDGVSRLEQLWRGGPSKDAFTFRSAFDDRGRGMPENWMRGVIDSR